MITPMPARFTDGSAASPNTTAPYAMKNAPMPYSNAIVVPDVSASQPASGRPATPARPVMTASARIARRSNPSRVPVRSIVMADMVFFLDDYSRATGSGADAATSARRLLAPRVRGAGPGPVIWESRETAHSEVLDVGEAHRGDRERDRRDHTELGQRQPARHEHDGDQDREGDVSGEHTDA